MSIAWICLACADNYNTELFYQSTLLIDCTFWGLLCIWIPLSFYIIWRDDATFINPHTLFGINFGTTIIFGILVFGNAIQLTQFWTNAKDAYIRTMVMFMFFAGIVTLVNALVLILQRTGVLKF